MRRPLFHHWTEGRRLMTWSMNRLGPWSFRLQLLASTSNSDSRAPGRQRHGIAITSLTALVIPFARLIRLVIWLSLNFRIRVGPIAAFGERRLVVARDHRAVLRAGHSYSERQLKGVSQFLFDRDGLLGAYTALPDQDTGTEDQSRAGGEDRGRLTRYHTGTTGGSENRSSTPVVDIDLKQVNISA